MKNLKVLFDKEDANVWKNSTVWELRGKRTRRFRKGRLTRRMNSDKRNERLRSAWE